MPHWARRRFDRTRNLQPGRPGADHPGIVVRVTLGTRIGSAVFVDGTLVDNSEYGHLILGGIEAEQLASAPAREQFIIGRGISAEFRRFCEGLRTATPVVAATLGNDAGIVGAAIALRERAAAPTADLLDMDRPRR